MLDALLEDTDLLTEDPPRGGTPISFPRFSIPATPTQLPQPTPNLRTPIPESALPPRLNPPHSSSRAPQAGPLPDFNNRPPSAAGLFEGCSNHNVHAPHGVLLSGEVSTAHHQPSAPPLQLPALPQTPWLQNELGASSRAAHPAPQQPPPFLNFQPQPTSIGMGMVYGSMAYHDLQSALVRAQLARVMQEREEHERSARDARVREAQMRAYFGFPF